MTSTSLLQLVDNLQQAGKIRNLQQVCGVSGCVYKRPGLEAVERVIERGIVRKQFLEAIRVMKLEYYGRAKEHYANLIKDREVTLDFLGDLRGSFSDYQSILNYLMYWSEEHCA